MKTRHLQRCGMIAGAILAALLFFMGGAALRLLMGPVSLGPFAGVIEDSLNSSVSGLIIRFDRAVLEWTRADGRVNLLILGTKVFDVQGRIIAQAPQADLDFDAAPLLRGELVLKRFALMDVQLTAVRNQEGVVRLGFGPIEGDIDLLTVIRGILDDSAGRGGSLDSFAIRNARLAFHDEPTGLFVVSPDISITLEKAGDGAFEAVLAAEVEISGVPAQMTARAVLRDDGSVEQGTIDLQGFDISALAANSPKFAALAPYPVKTDLQASFALGPDGVLLRTEFALQGAGTVAPPFLAPRTVEIEDFNIAGSYDAAAHLLVLENADFTGADASASASGEIRFGWLDGALASVQGDIIARDVRYTSPEQFAEPLQFSEVAVQGTFDRAERRFEWQRIALQGEGLSAEFSGTAVLAEARAPALTVTGTIDTLNKEDVLRYWPLTLNDSARDWIANNIFEGNIGPVQVAVDLPVGFDEGRIADEAIAIDFPVRGMAAQYMSGLTWITQANGEATLSGDAFRATIDSAVIGPLVISNGDIDIPNLYGAPGLFQAHVEGQVSDMLALIDMEPLGYARRFNVTPAETEGQGAVDLSFVVPMRRNIEVEELEIDIAANVTDLAVMIGAGRKLDNVHVDLVIDNDGLTAVGTAELAEVPLNFTWREEFVAPLGASTYVELDGLLDDTGRAALGIPHPAWITGPIAVRVGLTGSRFAFEDAALSANLTTAVADIRTVNFRKEAGVPAMISANVNFSNPDMIMVSNIEVTGDGLSAYGELAFDANGDVVSAALSEVRDGGYNDFSLVVEALEESRIWRIRGRSIDARQIFAPDQEAVTAAQVEDDSMFQNPISVDVVVDHVQARDDIALHNVTFAFTFGADERLTDLNLDAAGPNGGRITGTFTEENGIRSLFVESDQASDFIYAVSGLSFLRDGNMELHVHFPADDAPSAGADYTGSLVLTDFTVVDQPFLARLFSIGSLDGPLRLLQGEGIAITRLEAPFAALGNTVSIRGGHASGPAIGASFEGMIDHKRDTVDLNGSLVPIFGLNSVLGALPILGDILVSKEGEGIFGLTYHVSGDMEEPGVLVNPLSMITPGIFRRIFEFGARMPEQQSQLSVPPATPATAANVQAVPETPTQ